MNLKRTIWILFSAVFIVGINACHRGLLKEWRYSETRATWCWGGDSQRRGWSSEEINPPLELAWIYKANSALGRAIVAADTFLFFGTKDGRFSILHLKTGESLKTRKFREKIEVTVALDQNRLVMAKRVGKESLRSIDLAEGNIYWKKDLGSVEGEPLILNNFLVVGNQGGYIFVLNSKTGELFWKRDIGELVCGSAVSKDSTLFVSTAGGTIWSFSIVNGVIKWKQKLPGFLSASPVLGEKFLFVGTMEGTFYGLSLKEGSVVWKYKVSGGIYQTAAVTETSVYFGTTQGVLYSLKVENGDENWYFETESVVGTSPVVSGNWVYFGTLDRILYGINRETGDEGWRFRTKGRIQTSPLVWKGMLVVASEDRFVYGFVEKP